MKFYVTMTAGKQGGRIKKLVFECLTSTDAEIVERNGHSHPDMTYVNISTQKPYYTKRYYANYLTKSLVPNWYR